MLRLPARQARPYRFAAVVAMAAIAMLFLGPLISQLETANGHATMRGMSHMDMSHMDMSHGKMAQTDLSRADMANMSPPPGKVEQAGAVFSWFDQCGYCSLWQHFPIAHIQIPGVARDALKPADGRFSTPQAAAIQALAMHPARPRAPPRFS